MQKTVIDIRPTNVITNENGELRSVVGPQAIRAFGIRTLITALRFEAKTGMRMSRGPSALSRAKKLTGLKTNKVEAQIEALEKMQEAAVEQCVVLDAAESEQEKNI